MNATLPALVDVSQRLASRLADRVQAAGSPWPARVVSWMDLVDLCRELDEGLVLGEQITSEALDLHRTILNIAISNGERLIEQIHGADADISLSGHDLHTLQASLEECANHDPRAKYPRLPHGFVQSAARHWKSLCSEWCDAGPKLRM